MSKYRTLEAFVNDGTPDIDTELDDGGGTSFRVKGKQIEAAVLFIDMGSFSKRTRGIPPAATLILVNRFFNWISTEGLKNHSGIIDKYIGDEMMMVFAKEFGSADPYFEAVRCAVGMSEYDPWVSAPHVGVAFGKVIVGLVETEYASSYSVFGDAVTTAARLAGYKDTPPWSTHLLSSVLNTGTVTTRRRSLARTKRSGALKLGWPMIRTRRASQTWRFTFFQGTLRSSC